MAKRSKTRARGGRRGEFVAGLAVGGALGLALALWVYPQFMQWLTEPSPEVLSAPPPANPRFDFYDILERGEEVMEETLSAPAQTSTQTTTESEPLQTTDAATQATADGAAQPGPVASDAPEPQAPKPVETPGMYVLQLGAFTREEDAESLRARVALVGMSARIQPVRLDRQTYYRVRVGPTSDLAQLNADRARLRDHRFDVILLKLVQ